MRAMQDLTKKAIEAALNFDWELALDYNLAIVTDNPNNLQALNRLAKSYMELGQKDQAQEIYKRVLDLDKYNPIALKNIKLLPKKNGSARTYADEDFIEEPGHTKTVTLIKLAGKEVIASLNCKQTLSLEPKTKLVSITTEDNTYVGSLPDDLSYKIISLVKKGYKYQLCVKSVTNNNLSVFIREVKRPNRITALASFSNINTHLSLKKKSRS